ncbi:MAG: hypothetical protein BM485_16500 [Desulfobulbaceae bacterium DB1]|nr:MAG: hypothetical protein BM485_16500 [Desulfobulbaceae bacterium DB1]
MPEEDKLTTIQGTLERITFHNEENGYTVARLQAVNAGADLTTIVGRFSGVPVGSTLSLSGWWTNDSRHGRQFKVEHYALEKPNTVNGIERYLGSGLVRGVGPGFAARIVKKFGLETLDILDKAPERLREVQGLGEKRISRISTAWQEQKNIHEIMVFLQGHNISAAFAVKIFKTYGTMALQVVANNPYRLAEDIRGIGFKSADGIALSMGIPLHDSRRARAALLFVLHEASGNGHCYLPQSELLSQCRTLLDPDGDLGDLSAMICGEMARLEADGKIARDQGCIYPAPLYYAEQGVASSLARLSRPCRSVSSAELDKSLAWAAKKMAVTLAPEQQQALKTALENRVTIITGGPGTGKSTILKGLLLILAESNVRIDLAAPTGRAAKRLGETCGREARTIHRLLEYDPSLRGFRRGDDNPLESDLVVVDEASMMDIVLANSLFKAISPGASLLLVGDVDQLPSVGPGNVLRDCIDSGVFPLVRLSRIYRQSEGSLISVNAGRINRGEFLELLPDYHGDKDFYFIKRDDPLEIAAEISSLCAGRLWKKYGFDPLRDIQVLTPMRKGVIGCDNLNQTLQQVCNPGTSHEPSPERMSRLRPGDKVMQIRNNYDKEVFNGDIGFVVEKNSEDQPIVIDFDGREVAYEKSDLAEIELAYAVTVHKSQGSEFKCVIVPVHTVHYPLLQRNLLYTAITRGKNLVIVIGSPKAIAFAIRNNSIEQRNSRLKERLAT